MVAKFLGKSLYLKNITTEIKGKFVKSQHFVLGALVCSKKKT